MTARSRGRRAGGLALLAALAVALSTVAAPAAAAGAQDDGPPEIPAAYHGELTVDGEPAPAGTVVEAVVDGEVRGSIEVDQEGYFGGPDPGDEKLVVSGGDEDEGANVTFYVDAEGYERGAADPTPASVEWSSQDVRQVDLAADLEEESTGGIAFPPSGGGGDDAGGGSDSPVAAIDVDPDPAAVGQEIGFSAADSDTPSGELTRFQWEIGGSPQLGEEVTASFDEPGTYNVELTVSNSLGETDTATTTVTVEAVDGPNAVVSIEPEQPSVGEEVTFSAADSTPDGELESFEWTVDGEPLTGEDFTLNFDEPGSYDVELTVTTEDGRSDTTSTTVEVGEDDGIVPGFGFVVALAALLSAAALAARRQ